MVNNTVTRNIVCFGDSNVWGYVPGGAGRYSYRQRWTDYSPIAFTARRMC